MTDSSLPDLPRPDLRTDDFDFVLPEDRIAAFPANPRDQARLLHVTSAGLDDGRIADLPRLLRPGDVLVLNDTKVIPARLYGHRVQAQSQGQAQAQSQAQSQGQARKPVPAQRPGRVEVFLHKAQGPGQWMAFARPFKRLRQGDTIQFADDFKCQIQEKRQKGEILVLFDCRGETLLNRLKKHGEVPLPPYIKRPTGVLTSDLSDYQTVFAAKEGAVAAPTAGLHFTPELLAALEAQGVERVTLTLHVGAGTFLPVKAERVRDHVMHAEWGEMTPATAQKLQKARQEGRRIVAVGTTSLRLLETAAGKDGVIRPFTGETSIFITPGYRFKAVDALLTNFHLPKSTLFMLVSAFSGLDCMKKAYQHAIAKGYRFYSYGDATLLERAASEAAAPERAAWERQRPKGRLGSV